MPANAGDRDLFPGSGISPEEGLATHPSILARKIPQTKEPIRLWSMGSKSWTGVNRLSKHTCNQVIVPSLGTCFKWLKIKSSMSLDREVLCMTFLKKIHYHVFLHSILPKESQYYSLISFVVKKWWCNPQNAANVDLWSPMLCHLMLKLSYIFQAVINFL